MNNSLQSPWWVIVTRQGPHGKGPKFYSGCATKVEAEACARYMNTAANQRALSAAQLGLDERFTYEVVKRGHVQLMGIRE